MKRAQKKNNDNIPHSDIETLIKLRIPILLRNMGTILIPWRIIPLKNNLMREKKRKKLLDDQREDNLYNNLEARRIKDCDDEYEKADTDFKKKLKNQNTYYLENDNIISTNTRNQSTYSVYPFCCFLCCSFSTQKMYIDYKVYIIEKDGYERYNKIIQNEEVLRKKLYRSPSPSYSFDRKERIFFFDTCAFNQKRKNYPNSYIVDIHCQSHEELIIPIFIKTNDPVFPYFKEIVQLISSCFL